MRTMAAAMLRATIELLIPPEPPDQLLNVADWQLELRNTHPIRQRPEFIADRRGYVGVDLPGSVDLLVGLVVDRICAALLARAYQKALGGRLIRGHPEQK